MSRGRVVRGATDTPFPADGPQSKYAALFDCRPCFDALRTSFVEEHTVPRVMELVHGLLTDENTNILSRSHLQSFHTALNEFASAAEEFVGAPEQAANAVWTAYQAVLADHDYHLSALLARIHNTNLLIVTLDSMGEFQDQGHFDEGSGLHSVIWLQGDVRRSASKRTH